MISRPSGFKLVPLSQNSNAVELEDFTTDEMTFLVEMVVD